ncbi:unnamed protein product, partial [Tilletia caries]
EAGIPLDELSDAGPGENGDTPAAAVEAIPTSVPNTLLQLAAEAGVEEIVQYLLIERRADPAAPIAPLHRRTTTPPSSSSDAPAIPHRTAYDLASARAVRDVFRRLMAEQPDWAEWAQMGPGGARVPSALTGEMEEKRGGKVKERRNSLREKARARETAITAKGGPVQDPTPAPAPAPATIPKPSSQIANRLGGGSGGTNAPSALRQAVDQQAGITPEVRARIEREKRARAAEARMKALQGGKE